MKHADNIFNSTLSENAKKIGWAISEQKRRYGSTSKRALGIMTGISEMDVHRAMLELKQNGWMEA